MSEEDSKQGFKVADKRRFDSAGNQRSEEQTSQESNVKKPAAAQATSSVNFETSGSGAEPGTSQASEIDFSSFVMSLATQALMQLGQLAPPAGMEIHVDKVAAKQTIDILSLLDLKTKGNLDAGEKHLMEEVLHNLRMNFVRAK